MTDADLSTFPPVSLELDESSKITGGERTVTRYTIPLDAEKIAFEAGEQVFSNGELRASKTTMDQGIASSTRHSVIVAVPVAFQDVGTLVDGVTGGILEIGPEFFEGLLRSGDVDRRPEHEEYTLELVFLDISMSEEIYGLLESIHDSAVSSSVDEVLEDVPWGEERYVERTRSKGWIERRVSEAIAEEGDE